MSMIQGLNEHDVNRSVGESSGGVDPADSPNQSSQYGFSPSRHASPASFSSAQVRTAEIKYL